MLALEDCISQICKFFCVSRGRLCNGSIGLSSISSRAEIDRLKGAFSHNLLSSPWYD